MSLRLSVSKMAFVALISIVCSAAHSADTSNFLLPGHVQAQDGEVSLFVDFNSASPNGSFPAYLVNRTAADLVLNMQDGDIYLKLHALSAAGEWVRAQAHYDSWCGNSYYTITVRPGHFVLVNGYQPKVGVVRPVRYKLHGQAIEVWSNAGQALVSDMDIERASSDAMSIREGSFEDVAQIALHDPSEENRLRAIWAMTSERFDADDAYKVLLQVREKYWHMPEDEVDEAIDAIYYRRTHIVEPF